MQFSPAIETYWHTYLATRADGIQPILDPDPIWQFGDAAEAATHAGALVKMGIKTATSGLVWELEVHAAQPPHVGDLAIVADGAGQPLCIVELTEVVVRPFNEIDDQFAFDYGEYGRTLAQWRVESWAYFTQCCAEIGREPSEIMPLICQRFRCIYPAYTESTVKPAHATQHGRAVGDP